MGVGSQVKTSRNEDLKRDYLAELSVAELVEKYDLSATRIYQLLKQMGLNANRGGIEFYNKKRAKKK